MWCFSLQLVLEVSIANVKYINKIRPSEILKHKERRKVSQNNIENGYNFRMCF